MSLEFLIESKVINQSDEILYLYSAKYYSKHIWKFHVYIVIIRRRKQKIYKISAIVSAAADFHIAPARRSTTPHL